MEKNRLILVDTDIFIKVYRGNKTKKLQLNALKSYIAVSIISVFLELYQGATTREKFYDLTKQLKAYSIIHIDSKISQTAFYLIKKHHFKNPLLPPDCLIAATAIEYSIPLFTDNISDFKFIDELKLCLPK